jgi:hypothetical protein
MLSGPPLSHVMHPAAADCRPLFFWMASFIMLNLQLLQGTTSPLPFRVCSLAPTWQCILVWQQLTGSPWLLCYVRVCMRRWQQWVSSFPHQNFLKCWPNLLAMNSLERLVNSYASVLQHRKLLHCGEGCYQGCAIDVGFALNISNVMTKCHCKGIHKSWFPAKRISTPASIECPQNNLYDLLQETTPEELR